MTKNKPVKRFSCLGFIAVALGCIGLTLVASSISSLSAPGVPPTATPKKGISTILKVSPIGTQPATAAPVATGVPIIVNTAVPIVPAPVATDVQAAPVAPVTGQGGYVCADGAACVKGNINSKGDKLYHLPGCPSYEQTQIDKAGEQLFVSEADAIAAGWSKAGNCN